MIDPTVKREILPQRRKEIQEKNLLLSAFISVHQWLKGLFVEES